MVSEVKVKIVHNLYNVNVQCECECECVFKPVCMNIDYIQNARLDRHCFLKK